MVLMTPITASSSAHKGGGRFRVFARPDIYTACLRSLSNTGGTIDLLILIDITDAVPALIIIARRHALRSAPRPFAPQRHTTVYTRLLVVLWHVALQVHSADADSQGSPP